MPSGQTALPSWTCGICGIHDNWGYKTRCRNCNAYPPPSHRALVKGGQTSGKMSKGKGKGIDIRNGLHGKGSLSNNSTSDNLGTYAFRQLQMARGASNAQHGQTAYRANFKELQDARRRNDGLHEQNKRLQKELDEVKSSVAKTHGDADADETMEEGPEELGDEERKGRIDKLRNSLPYLEETYGSDSTMFIDATAELEHHQRALRGAKPYKTHRTILERRVEKLQRLQGRDKDRLTELQEAAEEIRTKITATSAAIAERDKELEAAESELRELVLKAVGEEATQPPPTLDPARSWENVVGTVAQLVKVPGVPSEFTSQLEGMFNQLRTMVNTLQSHATASGVPYGLGHDTGRQQQHQQQQQQQQQHSDNHVDETPQLAAAQAEQLHEQQDIARRQRLQAAQTQHINRFVASQRAEQSFRPAGTTRDDGTKPTTRVPGTGSGGNAENEQARRETAGSSSSCTNQTPTAAAAATQAPAAAEAAALATPTNAENATTEAPTDHDAYDDPMHESGGESDGEGLTDQENKQVEAIGNRLSPEQKGKLRAVLQVRKARLQRRTQRHKKPTSDEGPIIRDSKR